MACWLKFPTKMAKYDLSDSKECRLRCDATIFWHRILVGSLCYCPIYRKPGSKMDSRFQFPFALRVHVLVALDTYLRSVTHAVAKTKCFVMCSFR